jgi:protein gp37
MPGKTKIEWADYSSNPLRAENVDEKGGHACVKISEGCANCWASGFNKRLGTGLAYTLPNLKKVDVFLSERELEAMRRFNPKPRAGFKNGRERAVVFPCDMTDLFGDWVRSEWIEQIFDAMRECARVDWFVLTKRPERMQLLNINPLGNIYLGASIENDRRSRERLPFVRFMSERGWKTWVSYEPALSTIDWRGWEFLDGMICGGESGPLARPMHPEWARNARDFCIDSDIPFFFKQWGEYVPLDMLSWVTDATTFKHKPVDLGGQMMCRVGKGKAGRMLDGRTWDEMAR